MTAHEIDNIALSEAKFQKENEIGLGVFQGNIFFLEKLFCVFISQEKQKL